jgi:hypothetical protein
MAQQLYFRNTAIGTHLVKFESTRSLVTPPTIAAGLFADTALINADSRNQLFSLRVWVAIVAASNIALNSAAEALWDLQGVQGDVEIRDGAAVKVRCRDWFLAEAAELNLADGFGGRFTPAWPLRFIGMTRPEYP